MAADGPPAAGEASIIAPMEAPAITRYPRPFFAPLWMSLLAGAIVTETIFSWPGIGRLTLSAISNRDYALVQGCILAVGLTYVGVNLLTDIAYTVANPRMRGQ